VDTRQSRIRGARCGGVLGRRRVVNFCCTSMEALGPCRWVQASTSRVRFFLTAPPYTSPQMTHVVHVIPAKSASRPASVERGRRLHGQPKIFKVQLRTARAVRIVVRISHRAESELEGEGACTCCGAAPRGHQGACDTCFFTVVHLVFPRYFLCNHLILIRCILTDRVSPVR